MVAPPIVCEQALEDLTKLAGRWLEVFCVGFGKGLAPGLHRSKNYALLKAEHPSSDGGWRPEQESNL